MEKEIGVYKRCSTHKQDLEIQDKEISDYLEKEMINPYSVEFYIDEALSGKYSTRPNFKRLLSDIESGKIKKVIATKLDRLSRSLMDLQNFLYLLNKNKVELIVIKDKVDTSSASGKLLFDIMGAFAEFERNIIIERMVSGKAKALREGKICHRPLKELNMKRIAQLHEENKLSFNAIKKIMESEGKKVSVATLIRRYKGGK